jgi:hypothetical protein
VDKWTGLFSVNGLGLNFCGIFEEKKLAFGFRKNRQQPKAVKRLVKCENSEKKSVNGLGFLGKCPGLKNKKTPWIKSL